MQPAWGVPALPGLSWSVAVSRDLLPSSRSPCSAYTDSQAFHGHFLTDRGVSRRNATEYVTVQGVHGQQPAGGRPAVDCGGGAGADGAVEQRGEGQGGGAREEPGGQAEADAGQGRCGTPSFPASVPAEKINRWIPPPPCVHFHWVVLDRWS